MSLIKGFLLCYRTGIEANKIFDTLMSLRTRIPIEYEVFQYLNEMDVPYPHVIVLAVEDKNFNVFDNFITGFNFGDVDIYTLENRLHEIKGMTFIKQDLSETFKRYIHEQILEIALDEISKQGES